MADRTEHISEIKELLEIFGKNDYRVGQTILNAVREEVIKKNDSADWNDIVRKLYNIENDELHKIMKQEAISCGFITE